MTLTTCPLLHGDKKKETDTETEKLIYYEFRRFRDCTVNFRFKEVFNLQIHLHKRFFLIPDLLHKIFLKSKIFDLRKKHGTFLNRKLTLLGDHRD